MFISKICLLFYYLSKFLSIPLVSYALNLNKMGKELYNIIYLYIIVLI